MASTDDGQFSLSVAYRAQRTSLVLTVEDKHHARLFTNTYDATSLSAKGLTQSMERLHKMLTRVGNLGSESLKGWSVSMGYFKNDKLSASKQQKIDLMPSYLSASELSYLRSKPQAKDLLFVVLRINEEYFTVDTQFKLVEQTQPKSPKRPRAHKRDKSSRGGRRSLSGAGSLFSDTSDLDDDQKLLDMAAKVKSLTRDNQVLKKKLEKVQSASGKKQKKMDSEREMRLQANKERFWLKQKLERMQKAIAARLKILGGDFRSKSQFFIFEKRF